MKNMGLERNFIQFTGLSWDFNGDMMGCIICIEKFLYYNYIYQL